ncbi:MAG: ferredoxin [Erysipelotrichaceae bacterium]|nr:ferredoxin [Erysipelotrichaceae bacterium]MDY5252182.1 ferredoxin [Erysipelotrichaceae bacterium]
MIRKIIEIDGKLCNGCGLCVSACHEMAIGLVDGKAKLLKDDYCDGLGDCLPACPMNAIRFVEREAAAYDEKAVKQRIAMHQASSKVKLDSCLAQWPCQIKLAPINASFFAEADLLIAADCCAYAYANMHQEFMQGKITLIGCSKLDGVDYSDKLSQIIANNDIKSVTVVRMEVPCCKGIELMVKKAMSISKKILPLSIKVISRDGKVLND